jgi:transcriptional regulator with XRE-family HTH domain
MALFRDSNDKQYALLVAENRFLSEIQKTIEHGVKQKVLSQADLARALDISEARVSQILSGSAKNLEARTLARIAHVLGFRARLEFVDSNASAKPSSSDESANWVKVFQRKSKAWETASNDDFFPDAKECRAA